MKKKYIIIVSIVITLIAVVCTIIFLSKPKENKDSQGNIETPIVSFANMKIDNPNLKLTEEQKSVIQYFDNDYFSIYDYENLQRYPNIYKESQVYMIGRVEKVIKSADKDYELLVSFYGCGLDFYDESCLKTDQLYVVRGKQTDKRFIEKDLIQVYGKYVNVDTYTIDTKTYTVPTINSFNTLDYYSTKFTYNDITKVAKAIFGNNIKIKEPVSGVDYEFNQVPPSYMVTLDNQSNANFKSFIFGVYGGGIADLRYFTEGAGYELMIAADLQHFIVKLYDETTKHLYLEYYDKDLNKIWSREFDNVTNVPNDYTTKNIALVADNDLFIIDVTSGKDVIEPSFVGPKIRVFMVEDGIVLVGKDKKDMIMKADFNGKILWKLSSKNDNKYDYVGMQIVNNNFVFNWSGEKIVDMNTTYADFYMVVDANGNKILETE